MKTILVVDLGSQYTALIPKVFRKLGYYSEIVSYDKFVIDKNLGGIVLSGGPGVQCDIRKISEIIHSKIPVFGICHGAQLLAKVLGAIVSTNKDSEYGKTRIVSSSSPLISENNVVWMSHSDTITDPYNSLRPLAQTPRNIAYFQSFKYPHVFASLFHPEVHHTQNGTKILQEFAEKTCKLEQNWNPTSEVEFAQKMIREKVGDNSHVFLALSGGVDSTTAAYLLKSVIGNRLHCILVDNGLMRKNEIKKVAENLAHLKPSVVDASQRFLEKLEGVVDPERKRIVIGHTFIDILSEEIDSFAFFGEKFLAQGTIYSDVIESAGVGSGTHKIKSHHNVGGLPKHMELKLIEPLRYLFKNEVRDIAKLLKVPDSVIHRHPFPGPGLGIRILGSITPEKVNIAREADHLFITLLKNHELYSRVWQAGAILLPVQTVGVQGDRRTYGYTIALRAVKGVDGMTADVSNLSISFLSEVSTEIVNKIPQVNRVVYDTTSKPPGCIEWE